MFSKSRGGSSPTGELLDIAVLLSDSSDTDTIPCFESLGGVLSVSGVNINSFVGWPDPVCDGTCQFPYPALTNSFSSLSASPAVLCDRDLCQTLTLTLFP